MRTILLLAGRSKRFWPLAEKSLFPICGKTLADHQVETLKKAGCKDITLVVGAHNKKELKKLFPALKQIEQKDLDAGMQGACLSALPAIKKEPVLIVSGNDVIDADAIAAVMKEAKNAKTDGAILAYKVKRYFPGGYLTVKGGKIARIIEKPTEGKEPSKLVNIVVHAHNDASALLAALKSVKNHKDDAYEQALHSLFQEKTYKAVSYEGFWQPVKYPWHLLQLLEHFLKTLKQPAIHSSAKIHHTAVIDGNVVIGEGSRVLPHATIVGPCVIGRNCIVGNNAFVRGSSIGDDCVVGYNTEIKGSILAGPVWTHMTYLGDSIIGRNVSFGGGCTTGNLRLDEAEIRVTKNDAPVQTGLTKLGLMVGNDCRFGIQVATNPGVSVGRGTFVAGGAYLSSDIPDESFVTMKAGEAHIRKNTGTPPSMDKRERYRKTV